MNKFFHDKEMNKVNNNVLDIFTKMLYSGISNLLSHHGNKGFISDYIEKLISVFNDAFGLSIKKDVIAEKDDVLVLFITYEYSVLKYLWEVYLVGYTCKVYYCGNLVYYGKGYR